MALTCCGVALAISGVTPVAAVAITPAETSTGAAEVAPGLTQAKEKRQTRKLKRKVRHIRTITWHWQDSSLSQRTNTKHQERYWNRPWKLRHLAKLWQQRLKQAKHRALHPPNKWAWLCIHRGEHKPGQGWRTNTGNGYYGGLQMDYQFMRTYGHRLLVRKGTANRWTWYEQMWVAERARSSGRGFYPWPNTARRCGLI